MKKKEISAALEEDGSEYVECCAPVPQGVEEPFQWADFTAQRKGYNNYYYIWNKLKKAQFCNQID